jgi:5'-3' exonuclease
MSILRIFNVSDYIYAGAAPRDKKNSYSKMPYYYAGVRELPSGEYSASKLPTGGLSFMLNPIFESFTQDVNKEETLIFCIDSTPTIKSNMYKELLKDEKGYKANRQKPPIEVIIQKEAIKDLLKLVSPNVLQVEGYEADDIISSIVHKYKKHYDKVIIHTRDSDLYCLVDDNVIIDLVGTQGKVVTKENYGDVLRNRENYPLKFNSILLEKLYYSDVSDNIPGVGLEIRKQVESFIPEDNYKFLINFNILRSWVAQATNYNKIVIGVLDLIIPLSVPDEFLEVYDEIIEFDKLAYMGYKIQNKYCKTNHWFDGDKEDVKEVLNYYTDEFYMRGGRFNG